jgi:hypothetical protein
VGPAFHFTDGAIDSENKILGRRHARRADDQPPTGSDIAHPTGADEDPEPFLDIVDVHVMDPAVHHRWQIRKPLLRCRNGQTQRY